MYIRSSHWWLLLPPQAYRPYISCPMFLLSSSLSYPPSLPSSPFFFLLQSIHSSLLSLFQTILSQGLCITFSLAQAPSHHSTFYSKVTTSKICFQLDCCSILLHSLLSYPGLFSFLVLLSSLNFHLFTVCFLHYNEKETSQLFSLLKHMLFKSTCKSETLKGFKMYKCLGSMHFGLKYYEIRLTHVFLENDYRESCLGHSS